MQSASPSHIPFIPINRPNEVFRIILITIESRELAIKFGPITTAGSDAHTPEKIGEGYTVVSDDCETWQDILEEVKAGRVEVYSHNRTVVDTIKYGVKSIVEWIFRGFKRM